MKREDDVTPLIGAESALELAIRRDAAARPDDDELARRIVARTAWTRPAKATGRRRRTVAVAAAAVVVLASVGYGSARVLTRYVLAPVTLELDPPTPRAGRASLPPVPAAPAVVEPAPPPARVPLGPSAAALFDAANRARRTGRDDHAAELYARLQARHPGSDEARTSHVTLGWLWLDRLHQPRRAVAAFDAYLAVALSGPLAHEALAGRAQALERLGRNTAEARAWRELLRQFPHTLLRRRAEQRLRALGEPIVP